jgi:hypothetical protein
MVVGLLLFTTKEAYNQQSIPTGTGSLVTQSLLQVEGGKKLIGNYFSTNYGKIFYIDTLTNGEITDVLISEIVDFNSSTNSNTFHIVGDSLIVHTYFGETLIFNQNTSQITFLNEIKWFTESAVLTETNTTVYVFNKTSQITTVIYKTITGAILNEVREMNNLLWLSFIANGSDGLIEFDLLADIWFIEGSYTSIYRSVLNKNEQYFYGSLFTNNKMLFIDSTGLSIEKSIPFATSHLAKDSYGQILMTAGVNTYETDRIVLLNLITNTIDTVFSFNENIEFFYQVSEKKLLIVTLNDVFLIERSIVSTTRSIEQQEIMIYPNPSTNWVTATWKGHLSIFNNLGQLVLNVEDYDKEQLPIQHLPNGIYYMKGLDNKNTTWSKRFAIQR